MKTQKLRELALGATPGKWEVCNSHDIFTELGAVNANGDKAPDNDGWRIADCDVSLPFCDTDIMYTYKEVKANAAYIAAACPANILALIDSHAELLRKAKQYAENWLLDERDDHDREICICDEHYRHIQELFAAITAAEALV